MKYELIRLNEILKFVPENSSDKKMLESVYEILNSNYGSNNFNLVFKGISIKNKDLKSLEFRVIIKNKSII